MWKNSYKDYSYPKKFSNPFSEWLNHLKDVFKGVDGCTCQSCGENFKVDVIVSGKLWEKIRPAGSVGEGGLLCGKCIIDRIEKLGKFRVLKLDAVSGSGEIIGYSEAIKKDRAETFCWCVFCDEVWLDDVPTVGSLYCPNGCGRCVQRGLSAGDLE